MAFERLQASLTRGNLWLYVLSELHLGEATPGELKARVEEKHGFSPATITFYSVIYRLRREGLVERSTEKFRSAYSVTPKGEAELARALAYFDELKSRLGPT